MKINEKYLTKVIDDRRLNEFLYKTKTRELMQYLKGTTYF